jgi:hypothetical protein
MAERTVILSVHKFRRTARKRERELQALLTEYAGDEIRDLLKGYVIPAWARGVRVDKAGPFQWVVIASSHRGH